MLVNSHLAFRLQNALTAAASPNATHRLQAQRQLAMLRQELTYPLLVFTFLQSQGPAAQLCLRAAIEFKLWCKRYCSLEAYQVEEMQKPMSSVKTNLLGWYGSCEAKVAGQLEEGIKLIASREYFKGWHTLPRELMAQASDNFVRIHRMLKILKGITAKYHYELKSDSLYEEIIFTCNEVHDWLFLMAGNLITQAKTSTDPFCQKSLKTLLTIFYHLNFQDLHPKFQDNLEKWMALLVEAVRLNTRVEGYPLIRVRGEAMKALILFADNYRDDIGQLVHQFTEEIWELCSNTKVDYANEHILISGIKFFRNLSHWKKMHPFFESGLTGILQTLVYPHISPSKRQEEQFVDEPNIFFQQIFLRNDVSSLRSSAVELLQSLTKTFKPRQYYTDVVVAVAKEIQTGSGSINNQLLVVNFICDGLNHLFRGEEGCIEPNIEGQDIVLLTYQGIIRPIFNKLFQAFSAGKKLSQVMTPFQFSFFLRFIFIFRNYLPKEQVPAVLGLLGMIISGNQGSLLNYSVAVIAALISLRQGNIKDYSNKMRYFSKAHHKELMTNCGPVLGIATSQPVNSQISKCIRTIIDILQEEAQHYFQPFCQLYDSLIRRLGEYQFQLAYVVFDGLGMMLHNVLPSRADLLPAFQKTLLPYFADLLKKNSDLVNFVFQIFALVVQASPAPPESAQSLLTSILMETNWQEANSSLFLSYIAFIKAYTNRVPDLFLTKHIQFQTIMRLLARLNKEQSLLQITLIPIRQLDLRQLISSGWLHFNFTLGFEIYRASAHNPGSQMDSSRRTVRPAVNRFIVIVIAHLLLKESPSLVVQEANKVSPGLVHQILLKESFMISRVQRAERKPILMGICNLLFDLDIQRSVEVWVGLMTAMVENIMNKRVLWTLLLEEGESREDETFKRLSAMQRKKDEMMSMDQQKYIAEKTRLFMQGRGKEMICNLPSEIFNGLNNLMQAKLR